MNLYDLFMKPLEKKILHRLRQKMIPLAHGNVLEIGIGTGVNLTLYNYDKVNTLTGLDVKLSKEIVSKAGSKMTLIESGAEQMPFADNSFDTVVATLVLCSVECPQKSIHEIKRVLKSGGCYIFIEHILPSDKNIARIFQTCNSLWSRLTGGCHLNRTTALLIKGNFAIKVMERAARTVLCYGVAENTK